MTAIPAPIPENEMERLMSLSDLDIDYSDHQNTFKDLARLAAKVTGSTISLVNLIDSLTQWTVANYGLDLDQMLREDSVCQYTILKDDFFEIADLSADERFKEKFYVTGDPNVRYYYGVPLKTRDGVSIGALCVLDQQRLSLDPEKIELLKIIADEVVGRLKTVKTIESLKYKLNEAKLAQKKVAHDIRGPLGGIVGLAQIIRDQGESNQMDEVLEFINLIHRSGNSILDLASEILDTHKEKRSTPASKVDNGWFDLRIFKEKLEKLYGPQARYKQIDFAVNITPSTANVAFSKNKLLQITGNLISNSIKFTPAHAKVTVNLSLLLHLDMPTLQVIVSDEGVGMSPESIAAILSGEAFSTDGTNGEQGYGFGLALVKHLVSSLGGEMDIKSELGKGTSFIIDLPQSLY